ncbi:MAG: helix-turn-helix domain-containing protein [Methylococcaceae bacterium]|nr:helix-turn-helix domain-containing protein [Methylococcaceae bacterium]
MRSISQNQTTLSRHQAAEHLGVHVATVDRLIKDGKLPRVKITQTRVMILKKDIETFLRKNRAVVTESKENLRKSGRNSKIAPC